MRFVDGKKTFLIILRGSVATLALFLAFISLPVAGLLLGIFTPLPAAYYTIKGGRGMGVAIALISAAVVAAVSDLSSLVLYLVLAVPVSLLLPFFLERGKGGAKSLAYTVTINLALILALAVSYGIFKQVNLDQQVLKGVQASISQTMAIYEKGGIKGEDLNALQQGVKQAGALFGRIYPALLVITLINIAGLNLAVLKRLWSRLPSPPAIGEFQTFRNPEPLIWVVIAAGFSMLLSEPDVTRIALNILIVTLFMYFIQGLAIILHFFNRLSVPLLVRGIFYFLLAVQPYLAAGVAAIGVFDTWGNFRTPRKPKNL